jgi:two-component system, NarL family, nitrate/nitrite response regulator NarL
MPERIRIFVVDDHALFREGLIRLLDTDDALVVAGSAGSASSALEQLARIPTDVLILDYELGADTALGVVRSLREHNIQARILVVTAGLPDREAMELIRLGVCGIFHKKNSPEELHRCIREVAAGKILIDQSYLQALAASVSMPAEAPISLTDRDRKVLRMLLEGNSNKEIAEQLSLSESSAKAALQQLFAKTGVRTRSQLVRFALEKLRDQL